MVPEPSQGKEAQIVAQLQSLRDFGKDGSGQDWNLGVVETMGQNWVNAVIPRGTLSTQSIGEALSFLDRKDQEGFTQLMARFKGQEEATTANALNLLSQAVAEGRQDALIGALHLNNTIINLQALLETDVHEQAGTIYTDVIAPKINQWCQGKEVSFRAKTLWEEYGQVLAGLIS